MKVGDLIRYKGDFGIIGFGGLMGMVIEGPTTTTAWSKNGELRAIGRIYWLNGDKYSLRDKTTELTDKVEVINESR